MKSFVLSLALLAAALLSGAAAAQPADSLARRSGEASSPAIPSRPWPRW